MEHFYFRNGILVNKIGAAVMKKIIKMMFTLTVRRGEFMPPHSISFCINSYVFGEKNMTVYETGIQKRSQNEFKMSIIPCKAADTLYCPQILKLFRTTKMQ